MKLAIKLKELIDSGKLSDESYDYELFEALDLHQGHGRHCLDELFYEIGCKDADLEDESEDDSLLWFTSSQLDEEGGEIHVEEIKN